MLNKTDKIGNHTKGLIIFWKNIFQIWSFSIFFIIWLPFKSVNTVFEAGKYNSWPKPYPFELGNEEQIPVHPGRIQVSVSAPVQFNMSMTQGCNKLLI